MKKILFYFVSFLILLLSPQYVYALSINEQINENEVPYISTYYIKPIVSPDEDVIIDFYISDYNQLEYKEETINKYFTVTVKIDGKDDIIKNSLNAGDNSINLGKFKTLGEQSFSILCTDEYGRSSHELFNSFLVKNTKIYNEYKMTEQDLERYNIDNCNNSSNAIFTGPGIQQLLDDKKLEGYDKIILLTGIYCIDASNTIYIPSEFTLDMNNSTFKLNGFTGDKSLLIDLNNTFDSHVINGIIEGDYYEHDYINSPNNSEWVNGIRISGESKYCSYENMIVKNITGYGAVNCSDYSRDKTLSYIYFPKIDIGDSFKLGDIDIKSGKPIPSNTRTTCDFIDISDYNTIGYLTISKYLGYQGNDCDTWNLICHFYDKDKKYIESINSYQYRKVKVPKNAEYLKITILSENYPTDLSIQLFRIPTNCSFKNIKFDNCRCVGLVQGAMNNMLVDNCEFTNCGQSGAKCAYDAEDGWDQMQDVTFRNLNFYDNPNNDFLTCAGHNFILENFVSGKLSFWSRTNSFVVRNCSNIEKVKIGCTSRVKTGYCRFYNNTINSGGISIDDDNQGNDNWIFTVKDCSVYGKAENKLNCALYIRCNIGENTKLSDNFNNCLGEGNFLKCYIHDKYGSHNYGGIYNNCTLENISGNFLDSLYFINCSINNFSCSPANESAIYNFSNCELNNLQINYLYWYQGSTIKIDNCSITNSDYLLNLPNYSLKKPITLLNNKIHCTSIHGLIIFYDDTVNEKTGNPKTQDTLTFNNNYFDMKNSSYIIYGLNKDSINKVNIICNANNYFTSLLLPLECYTNSNINVSSN